MVPTQNSQTQNPKPKIAQAKIHAVPKYPRSKKPNSKITKSTIHKVPKYSGPKYPNCKKNNAKKMPKIQCPKMPKAKISKVPKYPKQLYQLNKQKRPNVKETQITWRFHNCLLDIVTMLLNITAICIRVFYSPLYIQCTKLQPHSASTLQKLSVLENDVLEKFQKYWPDFMAKTKKKQINLIETIKA